MKMAIEVTTDLNIENTKLILDGLSRCRGIDQYNVSIHVDDGCPGMLDMLRNHPLRHVRFLKAFRIGRDCNVYTAMEHGFQDSDYVVHLDDTAVPHESFLDMHKFCAVECGDKNNDVMAVSAFGLTLPGSWHTDRFSEYEFNYKASFKSIGFGTWKHRWRGFFQNNWHGDGSWSENIDAQFSGLLVHPTHACCNLIPSRSAVAA